MKNSWQCCGFVKIEFSDKNLTFRIVCGEKMWLNCEVSRIGYSRSKFHELFRVRNLDNQSRLDLLHNWSWFEFDVVFVDLIESCNLTFLKLKTPWWREWLLWKLEKRPIFKSKGKINRICLNKVVPTSFGFQKSQMTKNSWRFVDVLAKLCRSHFNLTIFFVGKKF